MTQDLATPSDEQLAELSLSFQRFADFEARGYSPLYDRLARAVAADPGLLALAAVALPGQPAPNLLFGATHHLLLNGVEHPLAAFYPSVTRTARSPEEDPAPLLRDFCLEHRDAIAVLIRTRRVQTNEVGRSACLMPAFAHVAGLSNGPLALVEIGASAGLNLLCDRFHYDYGDIGTAGDPGSPVRLHCQVMGGNHPPVQGLPAVSFRIGVDLNPIDVFDDEATAWLRALVWPEHIERAAALQAAIDVARQEPPRVVQGDGVELLPAVLDQVPAGLTICVYHSFVFNQLPREARHRFYETLRDYAWKRPIFDISFESLPDRFMTGEIEMARSIRGEWRRAVLAVCHTHGR
jgi:hypothetical protein